MTKKQSLNINYYNKHAKEYIQNTKIVDLKEYYDIFESYLKPIKSNKLVDVFNKCCKALKDNGVMHVSFKYGDYEGVIDDGYFTY